MGGASYTSLVNGNTLPNAWGVEVDIPIIGSASPQGFGLLRIWGVSLQEISQASNLGATAAGAGSGYNCDIYGGMAPKSLPLSNPSQAGRLFTGTVIQCFGNWEGTDMTLDFVLMPNPSTSSVSGGIGTQQAPKNIVLNWPFGQPLSQALQNALNTAFPGVKLNINISANIVGPTGPSASGAYPTLNELASFLGLVSKDQIKTSGYLGIQTWFDGNGTLNVVDGAGTAPKTKQIAFTDLVGQPTWIESPSIQFKTIMRADINLMDQVMLPPTVVVNTQQALSNLVNQRTAFQGGFTILNARHIGASRNPAGDAWVTVFEGVPLPQNIVGTGTSTTSAGIGHA